MHEYKISIILPVYNVEQYILECLESISNQSYKEIECIIVNDCSTDSSMEIVHRFLQHYHGSVNFIVVNHEVNKGLSVARNTGIDQATGAYIFFIDSDDYLYSDAISSLVSLLDKNDELDIVIGNVLCESPFYNSVLRFPENYYPEIVEDEKWIKDNFLLNVQLNVWSKLYRSTFLKENKLKFVEGILFEDVIWHFMLSKVVKKIGFNYADVYFYRINESSIMNSPDKELLRIDGNVRILTILSGADLLSSSYIENIFILKLFKRFKELRVSPSNIQYFKKSINLVYTSLSNNKNIPFLFKIVYNLIIKRSSKTKKNLIWDRSLGMLYRLAKMQNI